MDRRSFLRLMGLASAAVGVGFSLDVAPEPEVIAEAARISGASFDEISRICADQITPKVADHFFRNSPLFVVMNKESQ